MLVRLNARDLHNQLKKAGMLISNSSGVPILRTVRLEAINDALNIRSTNLSNHISLFSEIISSTDDFLTVIDFKQLLAFVKSCRGGDVELSVEALESGRSVITMRNSDGSTEAASTTDLSPDDFPEMDHADFLTYHSFTNGRFAEVLKKVRPAVSTEQTRYYLNGIHFNIGEAVATDGHRLIVHEFDKEAEQEESFTLPVEAVDCILKLNPADAKFEVYLGGTGRQRYRITGNDFMLSGHLIDGTYPNYKRVIPSRDAKSKVVIRDGKSFIDHLTLAIDISKATGGGSTKGIRLISDDNGSLSLSRTFNFSEINLNIKTEFKVEGDKINVGYNSQYLRQLCSSHGETIIEVHDAGSPAIITNSTCEDTLTVIMPMRV